MVYYYVFVDTSITTVSGSVSIINSVSVNAIVCEKVIMCVIVSVSFNISLFVVCVLWVSFFGIISVNVSVSVGVCVSFRVSVSVSFIEVSDSYISKTSRVTDAR